MRASEDTLHILASGLAKPPTNSTTIDAKALCGQITLMIGESRCYSTAKHTDPLIPIRPRVKLANQHASGEWPTNQHTAGDSYPANEHGTHKCAPTDESCQRASEARRTVTRTLIDKVPVTVCVWLTNERCREANHLTHAILMEKWTICAHTTRRRGNQGDRRVGEMAPNVLQQALKSNLAFSQVSAFLAEQVDGDWSTTYRCTLPGQDGTESCDFDDESATGVHNFPDCQLSRHHVLKIGVQTPNRGTMLLPSDNQCTTCFSGLTIDEENLGGNSNSTKLPSLSPLTTTSYENPLFEDTREARNTLKERLEAISIEQQRDTVTPERLIEVGGNSNAFSEDAISLLSTPGCYEDDYSDVTFESPTQTREIYLDLSPTSSSGGPSKCKRQRRQQKILFSSSADTQLLSPDKLTPGVEELKGFPNFSTSKHADDFLTARNGSLFERAARGEEELFDDLGMEQGIGSADKPHFTLGSPRPSTSKLDDGSTEGGGGSTDVAFQRPSRSGVRSSNSDNYSGPINPQRRLKFSSSGLPQTSSPAPIKRNNGSFDFDTSLCSVANIRQAFYNDLHYESGSSDSECGASITHCRSAPTSSNLLGNFEENALKGRMKPFGSVDGFSLELAASGAFCAPHVKLPVTTFFFNVADDNAPSPYLGHCNLGSISKKGYHVPKKGNVQATLFNPNGSVVKMFLVRYELHEMPTNSQTFVRQRTFFMPSKGTLAQTRENKQWLRYLIHLRFATSRSGKLYLHSDIRMLFSRKCELETAVNLQAEASNSQSPSSRLTAGQSATSSAEANDNYELRSFTEMPRDPKYSARRPTV